LKNERYKGIRDIRFFLAKETCTDWGIFHDTGVIYCFVVLGYANSKSLDLFEDSGYIYDPRKDPTLIVLLC